MQTDLGIVAVLLVCFGSLVIVVKLLVVGRIWKKLIENNLYRENAQLPDLSMLEFDRLSWLKWGIVIISFSFSLVVLALLPFEMKEGLKIGISGFFVGVAFVISYFISDKA